MTREEAELFLIHEAALLDQRRFRDWRDLFTEDGTYWVPAEPGQENPDNAASLFYDDREMMQTRIDRLEHPRIHIQTPPSRTVHIVSNVTVEPGEDAGEHIVRSNMMMAEYRLDVQRLFAGAQTHVLKVEDREIRIRSKRVDLINCNSAFEAMAVPI